MPPQHSTSGMFFSHAFGLRWRSNRPLASYAACPPEGEPADVEVHFHDESAPFRDLHRRGTHLWRAPDGMRYLGTGGLVLDSFGDRHLTLRGVPAGADAPLSFYGTVTALLLAGHGLLPMHGSAVEWQGSAILLCGPSGAGKSSLAAALLSRGARLLSDDLTVLHPTPRPGEFLLFLGRTGIRLFPAVADALQLRARCEPGTPSVDKLVLHPPRAEATQPIPLRAVLLPGQSAASPVRLADHLYRPRALSELPGARRRQLQLAFAASALPILPTAPLPIHDADSLQTAADHLVTLLQTAGL